jgi:hypothetical protein
MCDSSSVGAVPSTDSTDTRYKIGGRLWRIGDSIYSTGTAVVEKDKMVEAFDHNMRMPMFKGCSWASLAQPRLVQDGPV